MQKITKEQALEWLENPVTIAFRKLAEWEIKGIQEVRGIQAFHPFEPQKTQEIMANLNGALDTWEYILESLSPDAVSESFESGSGFGEDADDEE